MAIEGVIRQEKLETSQLAVDTHGYTDLAMTLARFESAAQGNPLYEAGVQLGRLLRTAFLADYFVNDAFRNELRRVLNRGEVKRAIGQHGDGLEYLTNSGSPGSLVEPPPRHATGSDWKDCPTRLESINLRGVLPKAAVFEPSPTRTFDVSTSGLCLMLPMALETGQFCEVSFKVPIKGGRIEGTVMAESVSCVHNGPDGFKIGTRFVEGADNPTTATLHKFVDAY